MYNFFFSKRAFSPNLCQKKDHVNPHTFGSTSIFNYFAAVLEISEEVQFLDHS